MSLYVRKMPPLWFYPMLKYACLQGVCGCVYMHVCACLCVCVCIVYCVNTFFLSFPVDLLVSDIPCNPMEQSKPDKNRNPYCLPGCSMQMVCKYRNESEDFCSLRNTTHLRVYRIPTTRMENSTVIRNRTKCSLTVEFRNMTTDFQGQYRCEDTLSNSTGRDRNIKVGGKYYDGCLTWFGKWSSAERRYEIDNEYVCLTEV